MGDVTKFIHITRLDQVADLSEKDRRELEEIFPDFKDLYQFTLVNKHIAEVGVEEVLRPDTAYPPQAEAYRPKKK